MEGVVDGRESEEMEALGLGMGEFSPGEQWSRHQGGPVSEKRSQL